MKKLLICFVAVMLFFTYAEKCHAVLGTPDHVPAATLIVPFFEAGIDPVANPQDTLPVITNVCTSTLTVHYETWDRGGNLTSISNPANTVWGNLTIASGETRAFSLRAVVNTGIPATIAQFTEGAFYRGFMTFDVVSSSTSDWPLLIGYPFSSLNCLIGQIYYTRLSEGSSNGLPMVAIESTPGGTNSYLHGFYQSSDDREQIDQDARYSAEQMTRGGSPGANPAGWIQRIQSRLYLEPVNGATSRVIVTNCGPGTVSYARRDGTGTIVDSGTINLNRYVNIIDFSGSGSGWLNLAYIPAQNWGVYAFSLNAASPPGHPELTWDAIFESFILP
jgi:hypothetical protein